MSPNVLSSPSALKRKRKREREDDTNLNESAPPSWEILNLLSHYMEPETLAVASCVSTTWSQCFSSENLWKSKLITHHPSLFDISMTKNPGLSYKRLFSVFAEADAKRHCKNQPVKPKISLSDLMFIVHVSTGSKIATVVKHGKDLSFGANERFQIEVDLMSKGVVFTKDMKEVKLKWQVVYKNWEKVLTMADIVKSLNTTCGWFTEELPVPENCFSGSSGIVGDVKPQFNDDNVFEKMNFAMVNLSGYGSLMVDDTLRYLQCFFL